MKKTVSGLYLILDPQFIKGDIVSVAVEAIEGGVDVIQYREKNLPERKMIETGKRLCRIARDNGVIFIVNDNPVVALAVDADGVHLGQEDVPVDVARKILGAYKIIGLSTHNLEEAIGAERAGVDYIGFGPIFHSKTKMVAPPVGVEGIKKVREVVSLPIIAIGGIDRNKVQEIIRAGASGVAVISAILSAPSVKEAVKNFLRSIRVGPCQPVDS